MENNNPLPTMPPQFTPVNQQVINQYRWQKYKFLAPLIPFFVLLLIAGIALFLANSSTPDSTPENSIDSVGVIPTPVLSEEERELNLIDVGDDNQDFRDLQSYLNNL